MPEYLRWGGTVAGPGAVRPSCSCISLLRQVLQRGRPRPTSPGVSQALCAALTDYGIVSDAAPSTVQRRFLPVVDQGCDPDSGSWRRKLVRLVAPRSITRLLLFAHTLVAVSRIFGHRAQ